VDFEYILIDVNRYRESDLKELPNMIKAAFLLDQRDTAEGFIRRLKDLTGFLSSLTEEQYSLFKIWLQAVATKSIPERAEAVARIINETKPGEVVKMVYNLEHSIKDMKEEAILTGKIEGKLDDARKMLVKNMPEDLIIEITGLSLEQIRKLKDENKKDLQ
jgi:predicted transposase/invertase (TIGR01784 family)